MPGELMNYLTARETPDAEKPPSATPFAKARAALQEIIRINGTQAPMVLAAHLTAAEIGTLIQEALATNESRSRAPILALSTTNSIIEVNFLKDPETNRGHYFRTLNAMAAAFTQGTLQLSRWADGSSIAGSATRTYDDEIDSVSFEERKALSVKGFLIAVGLTLPTIDEVRILVQDGERIERAAFERDSGRHLRYPLQQVSL